MVEVEEPFATVDDLKARWKSFPEGEEDTAATLLLDASQFMADVAPDVMGAAERTRKRVVCAVVRRSMEVPEGAEEMFGMESVQMGAGPYQRTARPINPHGDFYLTRLEKQALGVGKQTKGDVDLLAGSRRAWEAHDAAG